MALKRVALGTLAACLLAMAALVPPRGGGLRGLVMTFRDNRISGASRVRQELRVAERDLRIAHIRDSVLDLASPDAPITVFVDPILSDHVADLIRTRMTDRWGALTDTSDQRLIFAVIADEERVFWDYPVSLLPETDGAPCIAIYHLTAREITNQIPTHLPSFLTRFERAIPGRCGFFAAFGLPGPQVRNWLEVTKYTWASRPMWHSSRIQARADWGSNLISHRGLLALRTCAGGALDICTSLARLSDDETLGNSLSLSAALRSNSSPRSQTNIDNAVYAYESGYGSDLGPNGKYLLSDLVVEFGLDRFTTFWTSDAPVVEAFSDAFGISITQWMHGWAQDQFGPIRNGPGVPAPTYVLGIFLSVVFVGGSTLLVRRRQVR